MIRSLFLVTLVFLPCALAAPRPASYPGPVHVPIFRHSNVSDRVANLPKVIDAIRHKYGFATTTHSKRSDASSGYISLTDVVGHIRIFPPHDGVRITTCSKVIFVIRVS